MTKVDAIKKLLLLYGLGGYAEDVTADNMQDMAEMMLRVKAGGITLANTVTNKYKVNEKMLEIVTKMGHTLERGGFIMDAKSIIIDKLVKSAAFFETHGYKKAGE